MCILGAIRMHITFRRGFPAAVVARKYATCFGVYIAA